MNNMYLRKIFILILLVLTVLDFLCVIIHFEHDCTHDDNCPVCILINKLKKGLDELGSSINEIIISFIISFILLKKYFFKELVSNINRITLVGLKVELNN